MSVLEKPVLYSVEVAVLGGTHLHRFGKYPTQVIGVLVAGFVRNRFQRIVRLDQQGGYF
jgi:hypothetical protein